MTVATPNEGGNSAPKVPVNSTPQIDSKSGGLSRWASIATILALVLTIGGLVFSAGFWFSDLKRDLDNSSIQDSQQKIVLLENEIKRLELELSSAVANAQAQGTELNELKLGVQASVDTSEARYDELRAQVVEHARRSCDLSIDLDALEECHENVDFFRCGAFLRANNAATEQEACMRLEQAKRRDSSQVQDAE